jgi:Holliday junction resolvasome RuvABC endonuclease subunit
VRVLGLDLALSTGWALATGRDEIDAYGAVTIRGKDGKRFYNAYEKYSELIEKNEPDFLYFEEVNFSKYRLAYASYCRLSSIAMMVAYEWGVPHGGVDTSTIKTWWAGSSRADKAAMCEACRKRSGVAVYPRTEKYGSKAQEDMADAIAVASFGWAEIEDNGWTVQTY